MAFTIELLTKARLIDTYEKYAASGCTYWTSSTVYKAEVPASKRWFVMWIQHDRDTSSTSITAVYNSSDVRLGVLISAGAGTTLISWPNHEDQVAHLTNVAGPLGLVLDAGYYIQTTYGTAQSTSAIQTIHAIEIDI